VVVAIGPCGEIAALFPSSTISEGDDENVSASSRGKKPSRVWRVEVISELASCQGEAEH